MLYLLFILSVESLLRNTVTRDILHRLSIPYLTMVLYCIIFSYVSGKDFHFSVMNHILTWGATINLKEEKWEEITSVMSEKGRDHMARITSFIFYVIYNIQV